MKDLIIFYKIPMGNASMIMVRETIYQSQNMIDHKMEKCVEYNVINIILPSRNVENVEIQHICSDNINLNPDIVQLLESIKNEQQTFFNQIQEERQIELNKLVEEQKKLNEKSKKKQNFFEYFLSNFKFPINKTK
jgi:hypothetical protein